MSKRDADKKPATTKRQPRTARKATSPARRAAKKVALNAAAAMPAFVPPMRGYKSTLLTCGSWLLGAMSLLSLNDELKWVKVSKNLETLVANYSSIVALITATLFGWIDWRWIRVTALEGHVVILVVMVAFAVIRAGFKSTVRRPDTVQFSTSVGLGMLIPILIVVVLVPDPHSLAIAGLWLSLSGLPVLFADRNAASPAHLPLAEAREIRIELGGIMLMTLIVAAGFRFLE